MGELYRSLKSDFYKLKSTLVLKLHIGIPLLMCVLFLGYFSITNYKVESMVSAYLEVLAVGFPFIISVMTSMITDQEEKAGEFQNLLASTKNKLATYFSKLILLLLLSIFSISIAVFIFSAFIKGMSIEFYFKYILYITFSNIFIYILHLFISLKYGRGLSICIGLAGSLISALMLTGLGEGVWVYTPWAWGARLCDYNMFIGIDINLVSTISPIISRVLKTISVYTVLIIILSALWFKNWEGRKVYE